MRHLVTEDMAGTLYQWVDAQKYLLLDTTTSEILRAPQCSALLTLQEAFIFVSTRPGWEKEIAIIKVDCIVAYLFGEQATFTGR